MDFPAEEFAKSEEFEHPHPPPLNPNHEPPNINSNNSNEPTSKPITQKKRPLTSYFTPFETLGIEVSPLDSITQHMFYLGLKSNPQTNHKSNFVSMHFTHERFAEAENNIQARVQRLHNMFPQPLYLTGSYKPSGNEEFIFTRFHQTLNLEHSKKLIQNLNDGSNPKPAREVFYRSRNLNLGQMFKVDILSVDAFDMLELKITEPKVKEDFKSLLTLMKAYYDTTLTNPKKERIPLDRIQLGMIVVAVINAFTSDAKFVRVRIGPCQNVSYKGKNYSIFTVYSVDEGESYSVPAENLYYVDPDFMNLPFMVNKYQLKGFDFFQGTQIIHSSFEKLVNIKSSKFRARISTRSDKDSILCVELFLGKGEFEQDVNYLFLQELLQLLTPTVGADFSEAEICHCDSKGNVWLHFKNQVLLKILNFFVEEEVLLRKLEEETIDSISEGVLNNELFVARSKTDGVMYRARVDRVLYDLNKIRVEFVDWGSFETINAEGIFRASKIDRNYSVIPPQALKVRVEGVQGIPDIDKFFQALKDIPLQVRVAGEDGEAPLKIKRVVCVIKKEDQSVPIQKYLDHLV